MDQRGQKYRWHVEWEAGVGYQPLGEEGLAQYLYGPERLTVIGEIGDEHLDAIRLDMAFIAGKYRITCLTATASEGSWVEVEQVRRVNYRGLVLDALENKVEFRHSDGNTVTAEPASHLGQAEHVAMIYMIALAVGGNPSLELARKLAISRSAAAQRVKRARDKGLLPATTQGRAG